MAQFASAVPSATPNTSLGGILSAVLQDDPAVQKQMTAAEQAAVKAVARNVGMPDEYGSAMEYILRAVPYVKATYSAMDAVTPLMPTREETWILMRARYLAA